jgi:hypothetical protein
MLQKKTLNGIELTLAKLNKFYAFQPQNVFDTWSEDFFRKLLNNILKAKLSLFHDQSDHIIT